MDLHTPEAVAARVVAWHNRHPLARRITAAQVHSIGVVALPVAGPVGRASPAAVSPRAAPIEPGFDDPSPTAMPSPASDGDGRAAAPPDAAASPPASDATPPPATPSDAAAAPADSAMTRARAVAAALWQRLSRLPRGWPARAAAWWPARRPQAGPGAAAFSEDFAPPLAPARIARFATLHASALEGLPADWPRRDVAQDPVLVTGTPVQTLGLITAAVDASDGAGPRRLRLMLAPGDGRVLGTRAWSRPRVAGAAGTTAAAVLATIAVWAWPASGDPATVLAQAEPRPAGAGAIAALDPSASGAGAAASGAGAAASAMSSASAASGAGTDATMMGSTSPHTATAASAVVASALDAAAGETLPIDIRPRLADAAREAAEREAAAALAAGLAPAVVAAASAPPGAAPSDGDAARAPVAAGGRDTAAGAVARTDPPAASHRGAAERTTVQAPAAALPAARHLAVLAPLADRRPHADALRARMQAVASTLQHDGPPLRVEVYDTPQGLQAALWPFVSEADAERARVALAQRGVRTIVLDF